jgi:hypothetical protein
VGNKKIPEEVVTAMELAKAAEWTVSNRNRMIHIVAPDGVNISVGHDPNDESLKVFRSNARRYNLVGTGPARTPEQAARLLEEATAQGEKEAAQLNAKRRAYEAAQREKRQQIEAARQKANAAIQQGMTTTQENQPMPKLPKPTSATTQAVPSPRAPEMPVFDPELLGTKDRTKLQLPNGEYYCPECWAEGVVSTFKRFQGGMSTHRGIKHSLYNPDPHPGPALPADVDTAMDMLRNAVAEAIGGGDPKALAAKDAELEVLRAKLAQAEAMVAGVSKQSDQDRADFDKKFLEAQSSAEKKVQEVKREVGAKAEAEVKAITKEFYDLLKSIQGFAETLSPIQAIGKIDEIVRNFVS